MNLQYSGRRFSPAPLYKAVAVLLGLCFLALGNATAPTFAADTNREQERAELEQRLGELEAQINQYQDQITTYERQGVTLKGEIDRLNAQISKLNLQVKAVNLTLSELGRKIDETETKISDLQETINANEQALGKFLRQLYESERAGMVEVFLKNPSLSAFFDDLNTLSALQTDLRLAIEKVRGLRAELEDDKEGLVLARADAETLKVYQESQKQAVSKTRSEKDTLLAITKGKESEYQELLQETKETAAQIRTRLFELLGGGELSFEEAYKFAKLASGATSIRPALILAVLDRESALGRNVGKCGYQTAMHPTRDIPIFLAIAQNLGLSPDSLQVSCPIVSDGAYGGAMGPAQFIPSTWAIYGGYEKEGGTWIYNKGDDLIRKITGAREPSSPWRNSDAFVATALYLRDAYNSSSCRTYAEKNQHILPKDFLQERCAAAKYYAGGRWYTYRFVYGDAVVERADSFEKDIVIITS